MMKGRELVGFMYYYYIVYNRLVGCSFLPSSSRFRLLLYSRDASYGSFSSSLDFPLLYIKTNLPALHYQTRMAVRPNET